jgi:hypothetical protein
MIIHVCRKCEIDMGLLPMALLFILKIRVMNDEKFIPAASPNTVIIQGKSPFCRRVRT